jgi:hypothetical protein
MAQAWESAEIRALGEKYNERKKAGASKEELDAIHAQAQELRAKENYTTDDFGMTFRELPQPASTPVSRTSSTPASTSIQRPPIQRPSLQSAEDLARLYGNITFDEDAIRSKFDKATQAEYALKRKEYEQTEDQFYNRLFGTQSTALDTIRRANASAISSGAAKGMQAANELSAILGLQQESVDDSTKLAQARHNLTDAEAAAYAKNVVDALAKANEIKLALGTLGSNIYAADTQFSVGEMQYLAQLDAAAKQLEGMGLTADATKYSADRNLEGNKYTADQNLIGSQYTADQNLAGTQYTANKNYASNIYAANQNLAGTKYAADANREAAIKAAELNNAAQTAYYNHLASQPDLTLQDAVVKAVNDGHDSIAVALLMQATGASKKDAEKMVQDLKDALYGYGGESTTHISSSGSTHGGGGINFGTTTGLQAPSGVKNSGRTRGYVK